MEASVHLVNYWKNYSYLNVMSSSLIWIISSTKWKCDIYNCRVPANSFDIGGQWGWGGELLGPGLVWPMVIIMLTLHPCGGTTPIWKSLLWKLLGEHGQSLILPGSQHNTSISCTFVFFVWKRKKFENQIYRWTLTVFPFQLNS